MTVKELCDALAAFAPDLPVVITGRAPGALTGAPDHEVRKITIRDRTYPFIAAHGPKINVGSVLLS